LVAAIALSTVGGILIALPVLPAQDAGPIVSVNEDVAETIGWPEFAETFAAVYRELTNRDRTVILTGNYGEAGAIDRYGPDLGLPPAHSGHNAYWDWGPPPGSDGPVIAIGLEPGERSLLRGCRVVARIDNDAGIDNEEKGREVFLCQGPRRPWSQLWPGLRELG
jgi:hypothetical protein